MLSIKGHLVKAWVKSVDDLCDSDPSYDWNDACRAVAHALEDADSVSQKDIEAAAKKYWGNDDSRDYSITVADVQDCMMRLPTYDPLEKSEPRDIPIMKPLRFRR